MVDEILFWRFNFVKYNNKVINFYNAPLFHVHSKASDTWAACVFDVRRKKYLLQKSYWFREKIHFHLELEAIQFSLLSLIK